MSKKTYIIIIVVLVTLIVGCLFILPFTSSKYTKSIDRNITLNIEEPHYTISFNANGGTGSMANQDFTYSVAQNLTANSFIKNGYAFTSWNTAANGSGTSYQDQAEISKLTKIDGTTITLYAQYMKAEARIGTTIYETLKDAIAAVPKNNTPTTIVLLTNVTGEQLDVKANQNIIFDLQNFTISISTTTGKLLENYGTVTITNGTITSNSKGDSPINTYTGGTLNISGGSILMTNPEGKQAIYNDGGTVNISGGYIESVCTPGVAQADKLRAALHNHAGRMTITGGTIVSTNYIGLENNDVLTIGVQDGNPDTTTPLIQGSTIGFSTTSNFNMYNGTIKSSGVAINDETQVVGIETGYSIVNEETNDGYQVAHLGTNVKTVTFDGNGGTLVEHIRNVEQGQPIGHLSTPTYSGYNFVGWFTQPIGGTQINPTDIITNDITVYAHWILDGVCEINGTRYTTLKAAVTAVPANTQTTITVIKDFEIAEKTTFAGNKNIILDLNGYTVRNAPNKSLPILENSGTLIVRNGTIASDSPQGAINNNAGTITVDNVTVTATGTRQAMYVAGGTANITGGSVLSSTTNERATLQVLTGGTCNIGDCTITSSREAGVQNEGTVNIGTYDGNIDTTTPTITGSTYGVNVLSGTVNFYDGTLKGKTSAVNGTIAAIENNSQRVPGTETIDGQTYQTEHLELIQQP